MVTFFDNINVGADVSGTSKEKEKSKSNHLTTARLRMHRSLSAIVVYLSLCAVVQSQGVGFKTTLSQNGLNYFLGIGMELLQQALATLSIPNISGDDGTPIGSVSWSLTNIQLTNPSIGASYIQPVPGTGVSVTITNFNAYVTLDWAYQEDSWPNLSDQGTANIVVGSTSVALTLQVYDSNGRPALNVLSDNVNIGNLNINLSGGASWLYNFFIQVLQGPIQQAIQTQLQQSITSAVDTGLNQVIATLPTMAVLNKQMEVSYALTTNPTFGSNYVTLNQLGEFYEISSPQECPYPICIFNNIPDILNGDMVQMVISDYSANSAAYVLQNIGMLKLAVQDSDIPSYAPVRLNTTYWKYLIPNLYAEYPNNLMMVETQTTSTPQVNFDAQGAHIVCDGVMEFYVYEDNKTVTPVFTLVGSAIIEGDALLSGQTVVGNLTDVTLNFTVGTSYVGPFDGTVLTDLLDMFFQQGILPAINTQLQHGFPLPVLPGLTLLNPTLIWGTHYLVVSSNVQFSPNLKENDIKQSSIPIRID